MMLTDKVKDVLTWVCEKQGYSLPSSDDEYFEVLWECGQFVLELDRNSHRWWDTFTVIKTFALGQQGVYYIGYGWAQANRDQSIFELGWEFDPQTISFYKPKQVTVITYVEIQENEL